jgi:hypothetical protein
MSENYFEFTVVYNRAEYLSVLRDYAEHELARSASAAGGPAPRFDKLSRAIQTVVGSLSFWVKQRRRPENRFRIDAEGIKRVNRLGTVVRSWEQIERVIHCREAYLLISQKGSMPLPYRCFGTAERAELESMLLSKTRSCAGIGGDPAAENRA